MNNNTATTHHGARDGAIAGGLVGHHQGHTGRDAALGAGAGHVAERHHENHAGLGHHHGAAASTTTGAGVPTTTTGGATHAGVGHHQHTGLPVGTPGTTTTTTTSTTTVPKPSVGSKVSGQVDVMVGKLTNNPAKVQVGEIKKTQGQAGLAAAGVAPGQTAGSTGAGSGLGGGAGTTSARGGTGVGGTMGAAGPNGGQMGTY